MNVNVLKITSTPIRLSITSERARLEVKAPESDALAAPDTQQPVSYTHLDVYKRQVKPYGRAGNQGFQLHL